MTKLKNTQVGNPRRNDSYTVRKGKNGSTIHDYGGGKTFTVKPAKPKAIMAKAPKVAAAKPATAGNWWDPSKSTSRDKSLAKALGDPLKPMGGDTIVDFAKQIVAAKSAPVQQEYDRQTTAANTRLGTLQNATAGTSSAMQGFVEQQLAKQQQDRQAAQSASSLASDQRRSSVSQAMSDAAARMR